MSITLEIVKWLYLFGVGYSFTNAIYRIITQKDRKETWKESALTSLIALPINIILTLGLWLGW